MSFKRLHLNIWGTTSHGFLPVQRWDDCAEPLPDLAGKRCWAALDLSSTTDLSALVLAFPIGEKIWQLPFAWAPNKALEVRERKNKQRFDNWCRSGHLYATEGEVINYEQIRAKINELSKVYKIQDIAIDTWNAHQMAQCLIADGFEVIKFGMGWATLSPATKDFEQLVLGDKIRHDGHPVLRWCVANTAVESDSSGNIRPSKKKSSEKIDLAVASIMATARARLQAIQSVSPYQARSVRVL
jgi:phage terminase large subunit-like protein